MHIECCSDLFIIDIEVMENIDKYLYYRDFCVRFVNYIKEDMLTKRHTTYESWSDESIKWCVDGHIKYIDTVIKLYDKEKKGTLHSYYNECVSEAIHFYVFLAENRQYFLDTYGIDLMELNKKKLEKIAKILERGRIKTDNEFRMIEEHVSELCQTDGNQEMIDKLNVLLLDYEKLAEEKLQKRRKRSGNK